MGAIKPAMFVGSVHAAADYMAPGAIEINRYQPEILDLVRRRFYLGQRINQTPATGHPSRYFEQVSIPSAGWTDPRVLSATASQSTRVEKVLALKALIAQINFSMFDVEINQQQGQFAYLEAKDLADAVDGVLRQHDLALWTGNDTDLIVPQTQQYFGISGQITGAAESPNPGIPNFSHNVELGASDSLINGVKTMVAQMVSRTDYEVKPSGFYGNPVGLDLFDQEAAKLQLYYNETEVVPGVIVKAIPTQAGLIPLIPDAGLPVLASGSKTQYEFFVLSEEFIEYHWLTSPVPRVFQLGLLGNLAAQFVVVKFGAVVAKAPAYAHAHIYTVR